MSTAYHEVRLPPDPKRDEVWRALWRFHFRHLVPPDGCVLDLGCGYGSFINQVVAARRIAIDSWPDFPRYVAPGVEAIVGSITELGTLPEAGIDLAFASNVFEHISQNALSRVLDGLRPKLSPRGKVVILQPNYRYCYREYFDDYTHVSVYSHISLGDFLRANGYEVLQVKPRFLPLTVKSRLPASPWLVAAYLASPIKPLGKQMLLVARLQQGGRT